jgi:tetratricopeptide (TPR) repeat protein
MLSLGHCGVVCAEDKRVPLGARSDGSQKSIKSAASASGSVNDPLVKQARRQVHSNAKAAIEFCSQAIAKNPYNAAAYFVRGRAYSEMLLPKKGVADFEIAVKLDRKIGDAPEYEQASAAYCELEDLPKALNALNIGIEVNPASAPLYRQRGSLHEMMHQNTKALQDYDLAIKIGEKQHSEQFVSYLFRAGINSKLHQYDKAISDCTQAIKSDPGNGRAYGIRARIYEKMGKKDLAKSDFDKANAIGADFAR